MEILERCYIVMVITMVVIAILFWEHPYLEDNSYRNLVPSSGQMRGQNDYGCGPIRV